MVELQAKATLKIFGCHGNIKSLPITILLAIHSLLSLTYYFRYVHVLQIVYIF